LKKSAFAPLPNTGLGNSGGSAGNSSGLPFPGLTQLGNPGTGGAGNPRQSSGSANLSKALPFNKTGLGSTNMPAIKGIGQTGAGPAGSGLGNLETPAPSVAGGGTTGGGSAAQQPGGMPMMPPMSGAGAAKGNSGERSDASGLLVPQAFPGDPAVGAPSTNGVVDSSSGVAPVSGLTGLKGLEAPTAAAGAGAGELAALSGGTSSDGAGITSPQSTVAEGQTMTAGSSGIPMMPAAGGSPNSGGARERSDASGLLVPSEIPWQDYADTAEIETAAGQAPGGAVITGAVATPGESEAKPAQRTAAPGDGTRDATGQLADTAVPGDRIAVVQRDLGQLADEEVVAWDVAGATSMATLAWLLGRGDRREEEGTGSRYGSTDEDDWVEGDTPGVAVAGLDVDAPAFATWRPARSSAGVGAPLGAPHTEFRSSADEFPLEPQPEQDEETEDEQGERSAADLIAKGSAQWGGYTAGVPAVLE
jgi:hypothetical protein